MARLLRLLNLFAAALLTVMALVALGFLAAGREGLGGGADGGWIAAGWAALFASLAALAFLNLRRRLLALNVAAALPLLAGAALLDGTARLLCAGVAFPFVLTALWLAARPADGA